MNYLHIALVVMVLLTVTYVISSCKANAAMKKAKAERNEIYRNCFLRGLAGILAKMAKVDGTVSKDEAKVVGKLFADMGLSEVDRKLCSEAFRIARDSTLPASYYVSLFAPYSTRESKILVYEILWDIAAADEKFAVAEEKFLRDLPGLLGLEMAFFDDNLASHARKFSEIDATMVAISRKLEKVVGENFE